MAFKDVNKDGLKDVIIIAYYETGSGPDGAKPFPIADIYFQKKNKTFTTIPTLHKKRLTSPLPPYDLCTLPFGHPLTHLSKRLSHAHSIRKQTTDKRKLTDIEER
ncbi:hypothetical protein AM598_04055 [Paenibacillus polymyxa]|nr:hypothetical protein AM598_04055 [Paenibacillus polymyxa]